MIAENALAALGQIASLLADPGGADEALHRLAAAAHESLGAAAAGIWEVDDGGRHLARVSASGFEGDRSLAFDDKLLSACATRRTAVSVEGIALDGGATGYAVALPLIFAGRLCGVLALLGTEPFVEDVVSLPLRLLVAQAAAILHARQAEAETSGWQDAAEREQERLRHLQVAVRRMLEQPDMRTNLGEIARALQALGWGQVVLAVYDRHLALEDLITGGLTDDAAAAFERAPVPEPVWRRYLAGELDSARVYGVYYLPAGNASDDAWRPEDVVFAPLRLGQQEVVGVIRVCEPLNGRRPTAESLRALDILASQAGYIIENAHLLQEAAQSATTLADQIDELSMVHRADRELSAHLNMDRVMTLTMDWALRRTRADTGLLALMTDDRRGLVPFVTMGYLDKAVSKFDEKNPWPLDLGALGQAAESGETVLARGMAPDDERTRFMPGARSQIAVPLSMRGEVLGVIMLASNDPEAFGENDTSFLERLSRRAAVALDNARLFRQSEQLADDMAVLYSASRTITSTLDHTEVLRHIAQSMAVALECSSAVILDYQPETQDAKALTIYKVGTARDARETLPETGAVVQLGELSMLLQAIEKHRPLVMRAADLSTPEAELELMRRWRFDAAIVVPLVAQGELIGLAVVMEGRRDRAFTANEVFKAQTLASQASVALRQSLLYNEVLELEKIKSEMIRMASHDLRNPLNNVLGYVDLVDMSLDRATMPPDVEEYIDSLRRSAKTMQSLIDDLLTLERVESERESEWQVFDLSGLVAEVVDGERSSATLKHQTLELHRAPDMPEVFGSVTQLRQAISNLVGNAIKYTPEEGRVTVRFTSEGQRLQLSVEDNGYGISQERQARLFERFYRAREPGTDHIPGTGLGLSLVKTVVERHGGQVWFESEIGEGSTFGFWVPAAHPVAS